MKFKTNAFLVRSERSKPEIKSRGMSLFNRILSLVYLQAVIRRGMSKNSGLAIEKMQMLLIH